MRTFALHPDDPGPVRFAREGMAYAHYYSFVTMSTHGYGDIVPRTMPARACAALEAVIGQMYLVVLVARLVGLHVAHSAQEARPGSAA